MNSCLVTLLVVSIFGSQIHTPEAQSTSTSPPRPKLTTVVRIQSCNDSSFLAISPKNSPATTTTELPTTPVYDPDAVVSVPGGTGFGRVLYWKVGWARSLTATMGSEIVASDATTAQYRCLLNSTDASVGVKDIDPTVFLTDSRPCSIWNFSPYFDAISWTYRYHMKSGNQCLMKSGDSFVMAPQCLNDTTYLYNILS